MVLLNTLGDRDDDRFHGFVVSWSRGFMVLLTTLGHRDEDRFHGFAVSWFCHPQKKKIVKIFFFLSPNFEILCLF